MDYADKASSAETKHRALSLAALKRLAARHNLGMAATNCFDCGEPIPEERRAAQPGCAYCLTCQAVLEEDCA